MFDRRSKIFLTGLQLFLVFFISAAAVSAQSQSEMRSLFAQAESHYLYGEYELANPLYLTLSAFEPDNCNFLYKIGDCYLNIPDEKFKAIEFLEKAVKNSSYDANPDALKEKRAPLDAYFSLARAYMINNELEKAMNTLKVFQRIAGEITQKGGIENLEYVEQQILACQNAIKFQENPIWIDKQKLPEDFCLGSINENPVVSFDGNTIAYTERRGIANAIFYSRKENGIWQTPVEITMEINAGEDCSTCSLNDDGTVLFLYKDDSADGNIYSSSYSDGKWSPVKKLNKNVNTKYFESHATISDDGKRLFFTSNRPGGNGGLDIYMSELDGVGEWGIPVNLGPEINSPYNEDTPFVTEDGEHLFFSSEGHTSVGGYDIFKCHNNEDGWDTPQNIGYPISTTDDDRFYMPVDDGLFAYYSMPNGYKKRDIFYLGIGVNPLSNMYEIRGTVSLSDSTERPDENVTIYLTDGNTSDTLEIKVPGKITGEYGFNVNPGNYRILYTANGYIQYAADTSIIKYDTTLTVNIDVRLERDVDYVYEKIILTDIPVVNEIDSSILITDVKVNDVSDTDINDSDIMYYTVQVMALYNPVDVTYFKNISDMKVMYNDIDKFYRYTTGQYSTREEALLRRAELIRKGYPDDIFIKKVSK